KSATCIARQIATWRLLRRYRRGGREPDPEAGAHCGEARRFLPGERAVAPIQTAEGLRGPGWRCARLRGRRPVAVIDRSPLRAEAFRQPPRRSAMSGRARAGPSPRTANRCALILGQPSGGALRDLRPGPHAAPSSEWLLRGAAAARREIPGLWQSAAPIARVFPRGRQSQTAGPESGHAARSALLPAAVTRPGKLRGAR